MRKVEREITEMLKREFPRWRLLYEKSSKSHYVLTNGLRKVWAACTPKSTTTAMKNVRQQISRIERGVG
jgi:hypothetical protein